MKIVHVTEAFEGGVIEFLRSLTNATPDIDYTIIYGRHHFYDPVKSHFPPSVKFIPWPSAGREIKPRTDMKSLKELIAILKAEKPYDIIHLHSSKAGILGRAAALLVGHRKVIYAPHGAAFLRKDVSALSRFAYINIERAGALFPSRLVGVSESEAQAYKKIGVKSAYVNNGKSFPEREEEKKHYDGILHVVTTGRITQQKNAGLFNEIAKAFEGDNKICFTWIGEGSERNLLTAKNIKITGWVSRAEVDKILLQSDLYLSTALWEGLPYALLEAMSIKLPLLLSNCPGNIDVGAHEKNGFIYNKADEAVKYIRQYMSNPSLLLTHGEEAYRMVKNDFSVYQMEQGYRKLYAEMITKGK